MKIIDTGNICKSLGIARIAISSILLDFFQQPIKSNLQIVNSETPATSAVPPTKLSHIDICDTWDANVNVEGHFKQSFWFP